MKLQMVGLSHKRTPVELRERLSFSPDEVVNSLRQWSEKYPDVEAVLLSTCNRTELYLAAPASASTVSPFEALAFLCETRGVQVEEVVPCMVELHNEKVIEHLFEVACSLDSMVLGEPQIVSQVKTAYEVAVRTEGDLSLSHTLFQRTFKVTKRVANETSLYEKRVSIPSVAVSQLATQVFERFDDKHILVIGAGEMAEETMRYLIEHGARSVHIVNRSAERAAALAQNFPAETHSWDELHEQLVSADMVISTTGATEPIVTIEQYRKIEKQRNQRVLLILDLAVPRDFDQEIGDARNVFLYSVDDLQAECERNRRSREREIPKARSIIQQEVQRLWQEQAQRTTVPTIRELRKMAEELKAEEMKRLWNKVDLPEATRKEVEYALDRVVNKLLHPMMESLKEDTTQGSSQSLLDAVRKLFKIRES